MEENRVEIREKGFTQKVIVRETKEVVFKDVPYDLWEEYRDFARRYAKGNWTNALHIRRSR